MMRISLAWSAIVLAHGSGASAQSVMPPGGYSGDSTGPRIAPSPEPGTPTLTSIPNDILAALVRIDSSYPRAARASVKVVGGFQIEEKTGMQLLAAWSGGGFLPVPLLFSNGQCLSLSADYQDGTLLNGRLRRAACRVHTNFDRPVPDPPQDRTLRKIGSPWGFGTWVDDSAGMTVVTVPNERFVPLFTADLVTTAVMAMHGIDWPGGNVTLIGRMDGRLTVIVLSIIY